MQVFLFTILSFYHFAPHAIYISVIEVNVHKVEHKANIEIKVFSDDMLSALKALDEDIVFDTSRLPQYEKAIIAYFDAHLSLKVDGAHHKLSLEHITQENDTHWIGFNISVPSDLVSLELRTDMLTEVFATQSNIVSIVDGNDKEYFRLSKSNKKCLYTLDDN